MNIWFICLRTRVPCVYGKDISLLNCECLNSPPDLNVLRWLLSYCYDMALFIVWFRKKNWNFKLLKKNLKKSINNPICMFRQGVPPHKLRNWYDIKSIDSTLCAFDIWHEFDELIGFVWNYGKFHMELTREYKHVEL